MVDEVLLATLEAEAEELCLGRCGALRLFLWRVPEQAATEPPRTQSLPGG
jgi:hypothetical protein